MNFPYIFPTCLFVCVSDIVCRLKPTGRFPMNQPTLAALSEIWCSFVTVYSTKHILLRMPLGLYFLLLMPLSLSTRSCSVGTCFWHWGATVPGARLLHLVLLPHPQGTRASRSGRGLGILVFNFSTKISSWHHRAGDNLFLAAQNWFLMVFLPSGCHLRGYLPPWLVRDTRPYWGCTSSPVPGDWGLYNQPKVGSVSQPKPAVTHYIIQMLHAFILGIHGHNSVDLVKLCKQNVDRITSGNETVLVAAANCRFKE